MMNQLTVSLEFSIRFAMREKLPSANLLTCLSETSYSVLNFSGGNCSTKSWACIRGGYNIAGTIHKVLQKELYNFESLCKCIPRTCTVF
jgi:hypothetical protein